MSSRFAEVLEILHKQCQQSQQEKQKPNDFPAIILQSPTLKTFFSQAVDQKDADQGFVYVLQLSTNKWYVGWTQRQHGERWDQHLSGQGAKWTKKYPMLQLIGYRIGNEQDEDQLTLAMMREYGWWNVRGGKWCAVNMQFAPDELEIVKPVEKCGRCHRNTHSQDNCFARTTLEGAALYS